MSKPTKQQVVDALQGGSVQLFYDARGGAKVLVEEVADILVRAGLVEEPREVGEYWVKWLVSEKWKKAWFSGNVWHPENGYVASTGMAWLQHSLVLAPAVIGPRILPPEEA